MELASWLEAVAAELNRPLAQVALAWVSAQPGVTAPILGVSKLEQLHDNVASLEVELAPEQLQTLDKVSALPPSTPSSILMPEIKQVIFGGTSVQGWR